MQERTKRVKGYGLITIRTSGPKSRTIGEFATACRINGCTVISKLGGEIATAHLKPGKKAYDVAIGLKK